MAFLLVVTPAYSDAADTKPFSEPFNGLGKRLADGRVPLFQGFKKAP
jgi:hypothetical protein